MTTLDRGGLSCTIAERKHALAWQGVLALALALVWAPGSSARQPAPAGARIVVAPEVLVSRDGDVPHVEPHAAANPRNRKNLLGGAITMTRPAGGAATRVYASLDGGQTWHVSSFPEQVNWGGGDPQVAFTPHGTAIFVTLSTGDDEDGRTRGFLHAYRSADGGLTWSDAVDLRYSYDHPQIVVDHTTGRYAGRIYVGVLYGYPIYRLGVFRSDDDGRSWIGPSEATNGGGDRALQVVNLGVFSDGTLFLPYVESDFDPADPGKSFNRERIEVRAWSVTSADGGITFSEPRGITTWILRRDADLRFKSYPQWAVDGSAGAYRDRVYMVRPEEEGTRARLVVSFSMDRGRTWSPARLLDPTLPEGASQYMPAIAVNDSGVVAITWSDTRHSMDGRTYRQYFTASLDGGESWLAPVAVSTRDADPYGGGNARPEVAAWRMAPDSMRFTLLSAASRWPMGGDYIGLAADRAGVFHPLWADARSGTFQLMTAAVRVERGARPEAMALAREGERPALVDRNVTSRVDVVADPSGYDAETRTALLTIRLKNTGAAPIHAPLRLVITGFGSGLGDDFRESAPEVLNASNGRRGDGAEFDFSPQLGSSGVLTPGATTGAIELRLRLADPLRTPDLHVAVFGRLEGAR